jgi:leukotriene-A4 hydrolase
MKSSDNEISGDRKPRLIASDLLETSGTNSRPPKRSMNDEWDIMTKSTKVFTAVLYLLTFLVVASASATDDAGTRDVHSFARPEHVRVRHVSLDLDVDFAKRRLSGTATLTIERMSSDLSQPLLLDSRGLAIDSVEISSDGKTFMPGRFEFGRDQGSLGAPLMIPLPEQPRAVRIRYATGPWASGLLWLDPSLTTGKKHPFLFTQSQAIHARSWIPLQDSPGVRVTYDARIKTPPGLLAVMSANNDPKNPRNGEHRFSMKQAIPPYLIALAVGDLAFAPLGPRTGVYAEPGIVAAAAAEFADLEKMVTAVEALYGPYRWDRYDVLVLPPSFPFGGMENPRLTFVSPTVIAGDRSLVALLAHELAHSWSGNLVSNATWRDFWLNEGFTVYLERRIIEQVYGKRRAEMEAVLGRRSLEREMKSLNAADQILHIDLTSRDPDEGLTDIPYEKGALFLTHLENVFGREKFDAFLKGYFNHFAFQSITTAEFQKYLNEQLLKDDPTRAARANVQQWLTAPGLPADAPAPRSGALEAVTKKAADWTTNKIAARDIATADWSTHEWLQFLTALPEALPPSRMKELDDAFGLTKRTNSEIAFQWLLQSVRGGYSPAFPRLEEFLTSQGRRKFLKPLYEELVKTPDGKERARAIFAKARRNYHPIAVGSLEAILSK